MAPEQRLARFRLLAPEIMVLGSSRMLQFRASHFVRPFASMGMSFDLVFFSNLARAMVQSPSHLKFVVIGLDHWQFYPVTSSFLAIQPREFDNPGFVQMVRKARDIGSQYVAAPLHFLFGGRLSPADIVSILCRCDPHTGALNPNIGVAAMIDGTGVDREGSLHYDWVYERGHERGFAGTLGRVARGVEGFEYADRVDDGRFRLLTDALQIFDAAGVKVILMMPPVAGPVAEAMERSGRYGIVKDLSARLSALGRPFFDFHDPRRFNSSDCEFADGMHGGEVTALRMLSIMAADPRTGLSAFVDRGQIEQSVARFAERVNAYDVPRSGDRSRREVDFLGIGCKKDD